MCGSLQSKRFLSLHAPHLFLLPNLSLPPSSSSIPGQWSISSFPPSKVCSSSSHTYPLPTLNNQLLGNQGLRYFPYSGYLGLTPIRVEGGQSILLTTTLYTLISYSFLVVRTKLDDDLRTLQATSLTIAIRCYESRLGRVNALQSNVLVDHTQVLWSKSDDVEHEAVGSLDYPFRLTLPSKVGGFSTAVFVDYRCLWRIEAGVYSSPPSPSHFIRF